MSGLRGYARSLAIEHLGGSASILMYHRVTTLERDPQVLAVSADVFDAQMAMVSERFNVIPLDELVAGVRRRHVPRRAVAVTFDDGYADNLLEAEPILRARGIPATVFVSSGHVLSGREFWWDELERLVFSAGTLPREFEIGVDGAVYRARLSDSMEYSEDDRARDRAWNVLTEPANGREQLYLELSSFIRVLSPLQRDEALEQLRALTGAPHTLSRATHRPMTAAEVATLDASPVVEVGAHTVDHPVLSTLDVAQQRAQIVDDLQALASMCGRPMRTLSYPYGSLEDYTDETVQLVREAGLDGACSNHTGTVKQWSDPYRLPRNVVRGWSPDDLAARIEGWLRGAL